MDGRLPMQALDALHLPPALGGSRCLDFINTAEFRGSSQAIEFLHSYAHVLAWGWRSGTLNAARAQQLLEHAAQQPQTAAAAFQRSIALRETLFRIFAAVAAGLPSGQEAAVPAVVPGAVQNAFDAFSAALSVALEHRRLVLAEGQFMWGWQAAEDDFDSPLWEVLLDAAHLLTGDQRARIGQCPNCGWLFVDTTRNHSRRWCSMEVCGSQMKSRRQYQRRKSGDPLA